jgi:uncharacterized protein (DUF736 family)
MLIGKFTTTDAGGYTGRIFNREWSGLDISIIPMPIKAGGGPNFLVLGSSEDLADQGAVELELGAAWQKTSSKGRAYLSVKLDGPTLPSPVHCALIGEQQDGSFGLVWNRAKPKAEDQDETAAA